MAISLYDISVPGFIQTLDALGVIMGKGLAYCGETGIDPAEMVSARLFPDMQPFSFQIQLAAHHSIGAAAAVMRGGFNRPDVKADCDYAGLQALIAHAATQLRAIAPEDIDSREDAEIGFNLPGFDGKFTAVGFLTSFSQPNFHFHVTTAYDILRSRGVPVGKMDYLGAMRLKG
jgi:hypothetical protein